MAEKNDEDKEASRAREDLLIRNKAFHVAAGKYQNRASRPDPAQLGLLLAQGVDVNYADEDGWTALFHAGSEGHLRIVEWLVEEAGAEIDHRESDGCSPLWMACYNGRRDVVQYLLRLGADERITGKPDGEPVQSPAFAARRQNHPGIADLVDGESALRRTDPTRQVREKAREMDPVEFRDSIREVVSSIMKESSEASS